ncbi:4Fe-4S double cluster binding domain-containing protein [Actinomycetota bacterium]
MEDLLKSFIKKYDFKAEALPVERLAGLEKDFKKNLKKGLISDKLFKSYLDGFSFDLPDDLKEAKSIIILGTARPQHRLNIDLDNRTINAIIPPTYIDYRKIHRDIFKLLKKWLSADGYGVSRALLPLKLTAARSGMAKYGKNNIAYIGEWGSFHQLAGFYTDWESSKDDPWQEMSVLDACKTCTLCTRACPTGAISKDRFNIDTSRCLTFLNESKDDIPGWVKPESHNSLVGCMRCQHVCPYNKKVKDWIVDIGRLSQEDIRLLDQSSKGMKKDPELVNKLNSMGLYEWLDSVPILRNLRMLADRYN